MSPLRSFRIVRMVGGPCDGKEVTIENGDPLVSLPYTGPRDLKIDQGSDLVDCAKYSLLRVAYYARERRGDEIIYRWHP